MNTTSQERMSVREHVAYGSGDMALSVSIISASLLIYTFYDQRGRANTD
ncbi:Uncharacterised protein [Klebsiella michiganensis]|nr:Uncharacterised protein [Klebsiella michiganensis]